MQLCGFLYSVSLALSCDYVSHNEYGRCAHHSRCNAVTRDNNSSADRDEDRILALMRAFYLDDAGCIIDLTKQMMLRVS